MQLSRLLFHVALLLLPVALTGTTWLYLYPFFHGCGFPTPPPHAQQQQQQALAPFRLLSLGDPQLEGDSSLPDPNALVFPSLENLVPDLRAAPDFAAQQSIVRDATNGVLKDVKRWAEGKRKALDLWGNDWYLAHIVRSLRWWAQPTHVSVLGDLLGSQWVTDGEFAKRAGRYWGVVMRGLERVPDRVFGVEEVEGTVEEGAETRKEESGERRVEDKKAREAVVEKDEEIGDRNPGEEARVTETSEEQNVEKDKEVEDKRQDEDASMAEPSEDGNVEEHGEAQGENDDVEGPEPDNDEEKPERKAHWGGTAEVLGADKDWEKRVINIAGNHDVGYAGDIDQSRIERFERAFGSVNWDIWFTLPEALLSNDTDNISRRNADRPPTLRLVVLNTMNLDAPAWSPELQTETYDFMNHIITSSLPVSDKTHATILLTHIPLEKEAGTCVDSPYFDFFESGHGIKEQNMLSDHSTKTVLEGIFGMSWKRYVAGLGMGRRGIIVNGHDHAGCDVVHYIRQRGVEDACQPESIKKEDAYWPVSTANDTVATTSMGVESIDGNMVAANDTLEQEATLDNTTSESESPTDPSEPTSQPTPTEPPTPTWRARRFPHRPYDISPENECTDINASPHIREITLRSMMGEYAGYAGFLSAWFDEQKGEKGEWVFEFSTCGLGIQHWWWGIHIVDLILVVALVGAVVMRGVEGLTVRKEGGKGRLDKQEVVVGGKQRSVYSGTSGKSVEVTEVVEKRI